MFTGWRVVGLGGLARFAGGAGAFCVFADGAASFCAVGFAGQLALNLKSEHQNHASRRNT